ncbi:MAG TPA: hypothetical protein ENN67_05715 [Firmicutes bacterium]|nr:hypothetical protein [Bacillota bacterium]
MRRALSEGRLDDVSPERVREEILASLNEDEPWKILSHICETGIFGILHHGIQPPLCLANVDDPVSEALEWMKGIAPGHEMPGKDLSYFAFIMSLSDPVEVKVFAIKYHFDNTIMEIAEALSHLPIARESLRLEKQTPSELAMKLDPLPTPLLTVLAAETASGSKERETLGEYIGKLKQVRPEIDGTDFIKEGYEPGPSFRKALETVRRAKLDGKISTREEEIAVARAILDSHSPE